MELREVDSGYSKSGIHWRIHETRSRYAKVYYVEVNGHFTELRSRDAAYKHLEDTHVTSFTRVAKHGKIEYEYSQKTPEEIAHEEAEAKAEAAAREEEVRG
jgi:hypothetical protein